MMTSLSTVCFLTATLLAQNETATGPGLTPVRSIITVESRHDHDKHVPTLSRADVMAHERDNRLQVTGLDTKPGLELYFLIDDASGISLGSQLADLRLFIDAQPANVSIGIGYMRNGTVQILQELTTNHAASSKALRLPFSGAGAMPSPFLSVSDLIKRWPASPNRREVVLIASGLDPLGGLGPANPYLDAAIQDAQRAGILIFAIYTPPAGHGRHAFFGLTWAQSHLAQIAEETGGEAYMLGFGAPVSFAPYLADIGERLAHQYTVTFLMKAEHKGSLRAVRFNTELPNAEIVAPARVHVPPESAPR